MDKTIRKLVALLDSNDLSLRTAAIQVIGEMGLSSKPVIRGIAKCLREPYEQLQLAALKGLARLGATEVSHMVVPLILSPGALREQAMAVTSAIGASVVPQLKSLYPQADFHGKRAVTTALSRVGGKAALQFLLKILPKEPFELQKHLTISICETLDRMQPGQQATAYPLVLQLLKSRETIKNPQIRITGIIMLGHFRGQKLAARARKALQGFTDKKYPPELRRYALVSFSRLITEAKVTPDLVNHLMKLLCDEDWHNIVQHALNAFQRLNLPPRSLAGLVDLLRKSPHFSVHIHILERLQEVNSPEIAEAIIPFLADARFRVREAAEAALRRVPSAIESLFRVLMKSDDLEVTQRVNSILRDFPQEARQKYVDRAAARLVTLFERNDPHYRSFLDFIRAIDPDPLRKLIYQKSKSLKTGKSREKWARICSYLQLLWDNHLITAEGRYLFAVALIRQSAKDLAPASRRAELGLRVLRALIYDDCDALVNKLAKDKDLKPDDYFYLGFHFSEEGPEVRPFGVAMLEHVMKKYPRSKLAGTAGHKLELQSRAYREEEEAAKAARARQAKKAARKKVKVVVPLPESGHLPQDAAARDGGGEAVAAKPKRAPAAAPLRHSKSKSAARTARRSAASRSRVTAPARRSGAARKGGSRAASHGKKKRPAVKNPPRRKPSRKAARRPSKKSKRVVRNAGRTLRKGARKKAAGGKKKTVARRRRARR